MGSLVCSLACCLNDPRDFDRMRIQWSVLAWHTTLVMSRATFLIHCHCICVNVPKPKINLYKDGASPDSQVGQESMESFCSC